MIIEDISAKTNENLIIDTSGGSTSTVRGAAAGLKLIIDGLNSDASVRRISVSINKSSGTKTSSSPSRVGIKTPGASWGTYSSFPTAVIT